MNSEMFMFKSVCFYDRTTFLKGFQKCKKFSVETIKKLYTQTFSGNWNKKLVRLKSNREKKCHQVLVFYHD